MPDDRLFHKRAGHSAKVNALTDFEELAWRYFIESADDFGVMRFSAITLQADHDRMAGKPAKTVQRALERVRGAGLVQTFKHQDRVYCYQRDWQEWQKIDYPRSTMNPAPPLDELAPKTRELFAKHPGGWGRKVPPASGNGSSSVPRTSAERSGEITPKPLAVSRQPLAVSRESATPAVDRVLSDRSGAFAEWYQDQHQRLIGGYIGNPRKDDETCLRLCESFSDSELRDAALVWFGMNDDFATSGNRTIPKFASRITECIEKARKVSA